MPSTCAVAAVAAVAVVAAVAAVAVVLCGRRCCSRGLGGSKWSLDEYFVTGFLLEIHYFAKPLECPEQGSGERVTEAGYVSHMEWSQSSGWWQVNFDDSSLSVGDTPSWDNTLKFTKDGVLSAPKLDTGQGSNELYDMDQNVLKNTIINWEKTIRKYGDWGIVRSGNWAIG